MGFEWEKRKKHFSSHRFLSLLAGWRGNEMMQEWSFPISFLSFFFSILLDFRCVHEYSVKSTMRKERHSLPPFFSFLGRKCNFVCMDKTKEISLLYFVFLSSYRPYFAFTYSFLPGIPEQIHLPGLTHVRTKPSLSHVPVMCEVFIFIFIFYKNSSLYRT